MSTTTTAIVPRSVAEAEQLSHSLSKSSLVAEALRARPHDVLAAILTGAELGLPPMAATKAVVMIKGRPTLSAQALVAVALAHPSCVYLRCVETTPERATYETLRKGHPEPTRLSWTIKQANAAGLGGDNWRKYPSEMLRARCQAAIVRMVYPDATLGMLATEELSDAPADLSEVEVDAVRVTEARPEIVSRQAVAAALPPAPERQPGEDDGEVPAEEELGPSAAQSMQRQLGRELDAQEVADPCLRPGFDPGDASDAAESEAHDLLGEASTPADLAPRSGLVDRVAELAGRMTREAGSRTRAYYLKRKVELSKATEPAPAIAEEIAAQEGQS